MTHVRVDEQRTYNGFTYREGLYLITTDTKAHDPANFVIDAGTAALLHKNYPKVVSLVSDVPKPEPEPTVPTEVLSFDETVTVELEPPPAPLGIGVTETVSIAASPTIATFAPLPEFDATKERVNVPESELDDLTTLPGVGAKLQSVLNEHGFFSFADIEAASVEELAKVPGISPAVAEKLKGFVS